MNHIPITAFSQADRQYRTPASYGPLRLKIGIARLPKLFREMDSRHVWVAVHQPDQSKSNLTRVAVFFFENQFQPVPEDARSGLVWRLVPCHRVKTARQDLLQIRLNRRRLGKLAHPLPCGKWVGYVTTNFEDDTSTQALLELESSTLKVRQNIQPPKRNIILPGDAAFTEKPLPSL